MNEQWIISQLSMAMGNPAVQFNDRKTLEQAVFDEACCRLRKSIAVINARDALEADRDQISLTLAVAKADRDKWFNRARDLTAELEQAKARVIELSDMKPQTLKQRVQALEAALRTICPQCDMPLADRTALETGAAK